MKAYRINKFVI
ncbi:MAG: hypothetical protein QG555_191, partial [Thermodesulfobacteriota bacterium]|nr:hypothetical protein [Thermodesulfobacteriota bacterium]